MKSRNLYIFFYVKSQQIKTKIKQNVKSKNDCNTLSSRLSSRKKYL